ncbi:hypothetical protein AND_002696 [Anopheles darlingi]|uniref:Uncharacterized protein n=1 Tax=Anopheles darlingi TaxID=43151 RepID=W5JMA1_ANODA|nr:hypothetical protein AND_002696 [Anopheles darlingi]
MGFVVKPYELGKKEPNASVLADALLAAANNESRHRLMCECERHPNGVPQHHHHPPVVIVWRSLISLRDDYSSARSTNFMFGGIRHLIGFLELLRVFAFAMALGLRAASTPTSQVISFPVVYDDEGKTIKYTLACCQASSSLATSALAEAEGKRLLPGIRHSRQSKSAPLNRKRI